jgi:hypothetical protein
MPGFISSISATCAMQTCVPLDLLRRGALGPWLAVPFDMDALHPLVPEFAFKLAGDQFMFAVIVAVADGPQLFLATAHARP